MVNEIIAGVGGAANYFAGASAQKAKKEMLRAQKRIADTQLQTYNQVLPSYLGGVQALNKAAGLGGYGDSRDPYGNNEVDRLQAQKLEQQLALRGQQQGNALRFQLGSRGISQGTIGSALARNQLAGSNQYAQFRRDQMINAPQMQAQRIQQLLASLGPGLGMGQQAASTFGGQAGLYSGEENQAASGLSGALQNWQLMNYLQQQQPQGGQTQQGVTMPWGGKPALGQPRPQFRW